MNVFLYIAFLVLSCLITALFVFSYTVYAAAKMLAEKDREITRLKEMMKGTMK
jgi:hypothetical protein